MTIRKYLTASCLYTSVCFCRSQPELILDTLEGIKYCEDFERRGGSPHADPNGPLHYDDYRLLQHAVSNRLAFIPLRVSMAMHRGSIYKHSHNQMQSTTPCSTLCTLKTASGHKGTLKMC